MEQSSGGGYGDQVLASVSAAVEVLKGMSAEVCRLGGDELSTVLSAASEPNTTRPRVSDGDDRCRPLKRTERGLIPISEGDEGVGGSSERTPAERPWWNWTASSTAAMARRSGDG